MLQTLNLSKSKIKLIKSKLSPIYWMELQKLAQLQLKKVFWLSSLKHLALLIQRRQISPFLRILLSIEPHLLTSSKWSKKHSKIWTRSSQRFSPTFRIRMARQASLSTWPYALWTILAPKAQTHWKLTSIGWEGRRPLSRRTRSLTRARSPSSRPWWATCRTPRGSLISSMRRIRQSLTINRTMTSLHNRLHQSRRKKLWRSRGLKRCEIRPRLFN